MTTKKNLAALSSETPQQPLRRGRGLRLSQASKQARDLGSKPASSSPRTSPPDQSALPAQPAAEPVAESAAPAEVASVPDAVIVEAAAPVDPPRAPDAATAEAAVDAEPAGPMGVSDTLTAKPERDKRKIQLRKDLLKQAKRIARAQDRKLYQVIEAALEEYIERHGAPE